MPSTPTVLNPRKMSPEGRPLDGQPLMGGDIFLTCAGRSTTPFPKANSNLAICRWLVLNALDEAIANSDDFNGLQFRHMFDALASNRAKNRRELSVSDIDSLNAYLWHSQPTPVPSILRPLVPAVESASSEKLKVGHRGAG